MIAHLIKDEQNPAYDLLSNFCNYLDFMKNILTEKRFNQIISIDSSDKRAYLQLGFSNYYLGNYKTADSLFNIVMASGDSLLIKDLDFFLKSK